MYWPLFLIVDVHCVSLQKHIFDSIFTNYDSGLRPVCVGAPQVNLKIGVAVRQMIDLVGHISTKVWRCTLVLRSYVYLKLPSLTHEFCSNKII